MGNKKNRQRKKEEEERQRKKEEEEEERQRHETKEQTFERHVRELEEKLIIQIIPQPQQPKKLSELTLEQEDQLLLFTLSTKGRTLEKLVCEKLPIVDIVGSMGEFVPQKYKTNIKEIGEKNGSFAANKQLLALATKKILKTGWSRKLLQIITTKDLKDLEVLISPKQADLEEFNKQIGIPRNSLLEQLTDKQRTNCGILVSPMGKKDNDSGSVPVVHPELCISEDHFTKGTIFTDGRYIPSEEGRKAYRRAPRVSFNDVTKSDGQTSESAFSAVLRKHHGLFLFFIGPAGCGKTTMTKRMVKTWMEENKMAFLIPFAQINKDQRQSLKILLTKFLCQLHNLQHDPSEEEVDEAFHWILANQDKCLLIFDGLDQSSFVIANEPIEDPDINCEFLPGDLVSLLLSRKFLPNCRLAVTSRPHSLVQFAPAIQPDIVVFLNDLLSDDVKKLMNHYLEHGTAGEIMEKLRVKSPRIHQLIFNPLFLRLVAMLNNEVVEKVWTYVNTTAKLFFEIIDLLQFSAHHECGDIDVKVLNHRLGEMAFEKTMEGSVVFTQEDLKRHSLSGEKIQDFLFGIMQGSSSKYNTALLVGLTRLAMVFFFNHQSTQEFFSARFAVEKLAVREFEEFVGKLFPRLEKDEDGKLEAGEDSFAILRVLVIGCVNEIKSRQLDGEEILVKKNFFIKFLCGHLRQLFFPNDGCGDVWWFGDLTANGHQKQMLVDMMDFREEGVCSEIREHLKDVNFRFNFGTSLEVAAHREGFIHFFTHFVSDVKYLWLDIGRCTNGKWSDDEIRRLFQIIQHSSPKIEDMWIEMKSQLERVSDVVPTFPVLTRKVTLSLRGGDDKRPEFCRKLKEEIINFDTSKLQTKELTVVLKDQDRGRRIILEVVVRRGKPPRFIHEDFPS